MAFATQHRKNLPSCSKSWTFRNTQQHRNSTSHDWSCAGQFCYTRSRSDARKGLSCRGRQAKILLISLRVQTVYALEMASCQQALRLPKLPHVGARLGFAQCCQLTTPHVPGPSKSWPCFMHLRHHSRAQRPPHRPPSRRTRLAKQRIGLIRAQISGIKLAPDTDSKWTNLVILHHRIDQEKALMEVAELARIRPSTISSMNDSKGLKVTIKWAEQFWDSTPVWHAARHRADARSCSRHLPTSACFGV